MKFMAWSAVGLAAVGGALFVVVAAFTGISTSAGERFFNCQCDSAIGPDPSVTATASPTSGVCDSDEEWDSSGVPTTNPYASLTVASGDTEITEWRRDCISAMASAPLQTPATSKTNTGFAVECARELALMRVGSQAEPLDSAPAAMVREVIYQASAALTSGRCDTPAGDTSEPVGAGVPAGQAEYTHPTGSCAQNSESTVVELPSRLADQGLCGQRVQLDAVSPGDLIFWDYRQHAPTRVGVAVDQTRVVTADPSTGQFAVIEIPAGGDARAKRVLAGPGY
ncbi:hypothetical protein GV791_25250 [Nocardia cyriacigeorgica]|uniref:Uncharacterized protein n=2 Tax=Nocardia cyriacigeorgica TaxID=135487 RepID=H6R6I3_NOCCG|nr:hypothetical protein [Nocardia cyriacigeorgica]MBF6082940.1 hypothetical protein [Nocardia cyriacigeorgica]NEW35848.1 hypothetical protein [Nocardia cyriacigeorgica]CCF62146.1 exported protein of unknown function [Nocardia cyriacigeorgica GUH-2]